jgi:predicted Zn finger-like uncharacterized protein
MDVQCERCKTEYEFDDALVSGRGTTVRCTNCGHQFKVRRAEGPSATDRWTVRTADGHDLTFFSLRDLQHAISSKRVRRADVLVRGNGPPRTLGSITELEPFFSERATTQAFALPTHGDRAALGLADPTPTGPHLSARSAAGSPSVSPASGAAALSAALGPPREKIETLRPPLHAGAAPPPATLAYPQPSQPLPPPTQPVRRRDSLDDYDADEEAGPLPATDEPYRGAPRRRVGGWIVAVALLLAVAVVGWAAARPYLALRPATTSLPQDSRVRDLLANGEKAMFEGNFEASREAFDKSSVLAEHDPHVLLDQARLATLKADVPWLKLRLLPTEATDEVRATKGQLDELVARARRAADDAVAASPDTLPPIRARVDALRLAGETGAARALVSKLSADASQPETAYVLAALDLAEPEPLWTTLIERLRLATSAEGTAGRAHAALIYALASSGDNSGAKTELSKMDSLSRPSPLLPALRAFVERLAGKVAAMPGAGAANSVAAGASAAHGAPQGSGPARPGAAMPAPAPEPPSSEAHSSMQAASAAIKKGDFNRARQIYEGLVDRNPNDSEALAGLGDVARMQGNAAGAMASYKRAIAVNPSYLPALLGLADTEWARGDHAKASHDYADIVDRFPEGTYPSYVGKRAEGGGAGAAPSPADPQ